MTTTDRTPPEPLPRGQFSLLGLMSFVLAWSVYFSAVAVCAQIFELLGGPWERGHKFLPLWLVLVIFLFAWAVLALLYRAWRLRPVLIAHCLGPVITLGAGCLIGLADLYVNRPPGTWRLLANAATYAAMVFFFATMITLPLATLMMLCLVLKRRAP
jgi:hypothetical protein